MRHAISPDLMAPPERLSAWPPGYWPRSDGYWKHGKFVRLVRDDEYEAEQRAYEKAAGAAPSMEPTSRSSEAYENPFDENPFSDDIHDHIAFAVNGADLLHERALTARQRFRNASKNVLSTSLRTAINEPVAKLIEAVLHVRIDAGRLRASADPDLDFIVWAASYQVALGAFKEVERLGALALTPDSLSEGAQEPPLPQVQDWATVSSKVQADVAAWAANVRGKKGQMLIAKPSPGVGKTKTMVDTALHEQSQRQRVVMAVRTKEILVGELVSRIQNAGHGQVRLHVIQGRDESTCWCFDNVKVVQAHGYSPGSTVCSRCEYHPDIARKLRTFTVCPYYRSRQNAQNDTASARFGMNDYPIIATTTAGYLAAVASGGGRFGKFWPCDMLMVDEDPTDAFEPEVVVKAEHLVLPTPPKPEDRAAHAMATLLRGAFAQAELERKALEGRGWVVNGVQSPIHNRHGSAYAGNDLHKLFDRVASGPFGQQHGLQSATRVLRDVCDSHVHPAAGSLHGATTAAAVSLVVPPRGLSLLGEALFEEDAMRTQLRRLAYKKIHQKEMSSTMTSAQVDAALAESDEFDTVYRVRLEFAQGEWRFVFQDFVSMLDQNTNIIYGDAYANIEHTRQVFDKPASLPADPSYVDPVTIINHVARFPSGSVPARFRTKANITYLTTDGWGEHEAILITVLRKCAEKKVLIYAHGSLRERVEKTFADNNNFGVAAWAFENWGGGRGKDQYGDWDAVVTISDYVQNIGGMLHKVNARAARDTKKLLMLNKTDEAFVESTRIRLDMNKADIAHKMADPGTHWRIKQEHDRRNVSELAQALHRVRPLRSDKLMVVLGDAIPFTEDTIAAAVTVNLPGGPAGRSKIRTWYGDGCLTTSESYIALCALEEMFGFASPVFLHAFFGIEMDEFLNGMWHRATASAPSCQGQADLYRDSLLRDQPILCRPTPPTPTTEANMPGDPGASGPQTEGPMTGLPWRAVLSMAQQVWEPPAAWKNIYQLASQRLMRTKEASRRMSREFPFSGWYKPSWEDRAHPGYVWYSRHSVKTGARAAMDMLENQYGPNQNGVLYVPNKKPFIPY